MLNLHKTFKDKNHDYIIIPSIVKFARQYKLPVKSYQSREEMLDVVVEFANQDANNLDLVNSWIDETVFKDGTKDIYLCYKPLSSVTEMLLSNEPACIKHLKNYLNSKSNHLTENDYGEKYQLINAKYMQTEKYGGKFEFYLSKQLFMHDQKKLRTKVIIFPVFIEYYLNLNWLIIQTKPRSNIYEYKNAGFSIETTPPTSIDKEIILALDLIDNILVFDNNDGFDVYGYIKNQIFRLVDKYTHTPEAIKNIIEAKSNDIETISSMIKSLCNVPTEAYTNVENDVKNTIEKYLSVYWKDKNIFIKDREAYPLKLSATDDEESRVEQTAGLEQPLQMKAVFFDNKKMLYDNQSCDGVYFIWKKLNPGQNDIDYPVKILVKRIGRQSCGIIKFTEFTTREDINNVLFTPRKNPRSYRPFPQPRPPAFLKNKLT